MANSTIALSKATFRIVSRCLDAQLIPLVAERATEIPELVADETVDSLLGVANRLAHIVFDALQRKLIGELAASPAGPGRACRARPERCPARARCPAEDRRQGAFS
jgi:hypothetical protein